MGTFTLTLQRLFLFFSLVYHRIRAFFRSDHRLHRARFARIDELAHLISMIPPPDGLLLGRRNGYFVTVRPTKTRRELGNLLVVAPTRAGKGLLATSQLLSWQHSVVVNDIKGELFQATAGYRSTLGKVFVIDPRGYGHRFDPLHGKHTEDEFYSASSRSHACSCTRSSSRRCSRHACVAFWMIACRSSLFSLPRAIANTCTCRFGV